MALKDWSIHDLETLWINLWDEMFSCEPKALEARELQDDNHTYEVGTVLEYFVRQVENNTPEQLGLKRR